MLGANDVSLISGRHVMRYWVYVTIGNLIIKIIFAGMLSDSHENPRQENGGKVKRNPQPQWAMPWITRTHTRVHARGLAKEHGKLGRDRSS